MANAGDEGFAAMQRQGWRVGQLSGNFTIVSKLTRVIPISNCFS
jgi:hypothetical protein